MNPVLGLALLAAVNIVIGIVLIAALAAAAVGLATAAVWLLSRRVQLIWRSEDKQ